MGTVGCSTGVFSESLSVGSTVAPKRQEVFAASTQLTDNAIFGSKGLSFQFRGIGSMMIFGWFRAQLCLDVVVGNLLKAF